MKSRGLVAFLFIIGIAGCSSSDAPQLVTAEERYRAAMQAYHDENYLEALQHFDIVRLQHPGSSIADSSRYFAGMSRMKREEYILASYEFNQLITSYPKSYLLADAQYQFAECYYMLSPNVPLDQSYTQQAIDALQTAIEYYPHHPRAKDAERKLRELYNKLAEKEYKTGVLYARMQNSRAALVYFDTVLDRYYDTDFADDAMAAKIRILMNRRKHVEAEALIREFLEKHPSSPYRSEMMEFQRSLPVKVSAPSSRNGEGR